MDYDLHNQLSGILGYFSLPQAALSAVQGTHTFTGPREGDLLLFENAHGCHFLLANRAVEDQVYSDLAQVVQAVDADAFGQKLTFALYCTCQDGKRLLHIVAAYKENHHYQLLFAKSLAAPGNPSIQRAFLKRKKEIERYCTAVVDESALDSYEQEIKQLCQSIFDELAAPSHPPQHLTHRPARSQSCCPSSSLSARLLRPWH